MEENAFLCSEGKASYWPFGYAKLQKKNGMKKVSSEN